MRLVMFYCVYDPNGIYMGHKKKWLDVNKWADADKAAHDFLETLIGKGKWEYQIFEVKEETGARVYDTKHHKRL